MVLNLVGREGPGLASARALLTDID